MRLELTVETRNMRTGSSSHYARTRAVYSPHWGCPDPSLNRDISLSCAGLSDWLAAIGAAGVVVTDRLHVAVAATLLGKRLVYVDPYDAKISTYWTFTFGDGFDDHVTESSLAWLVAGGSYSPAPGGLQYLRVPVSPLNDGGLRRCVASRGRASTATARRRLDVHGCAEFPP